MVEMSKIFDKSIYIQGINIFKKILYTFILPLDTKRLG